MTACTPELEPAVEARPDELTLPRPAANVPVAAATKRLMKSTRAIHACVDIHAPLTLSPFQPETSGGASGSWPIALSCAERPVPSVARPSPRSAPTTNSIGLLMRARYAAFVKAGDVNIARTIALI